MNRFEVFRFDDIGADSGFRFQTRGDIAHYVLDKFGIVVSIFGDIFFVGAF